MNIVNLVDEAVVIDKRIKEDTKRLNELKAKLTDAALSDMENKNLKFKQIFGKAGVFTTVYKEKFEIDNFAKLKMVLGTLIEDKVTRKEKVDYDVENKFKKALIAIFKDEHGKDISIDEVLVGLGITDTKACKKKLKGDYLKDKKVLESYGAKGELEEELDAIRLCKNYELISRYFGDLSDEQIEIIKQAIFVEDSLSAGLEYEN